MPQGWIQGDWIRSTIHQEDLDDLANGGLTPHGSARLPGKESEPQPQEGECVLLATHVDRGFSLPASPILSGIFEFLWGATPPLHTQHHRVPRYFCVFVREFLGLSASLGSFQAHFHLSLPDGEKGQSE